MSFGCRAVCYPGVAENDEPNAGARGVAAKKKCEQAAESERERVREKREQWRGQHQAALAGRRVVFVDETGVNLRMARRYGRARRGLRAVGRVPKNYGAGVTIIGAMDKSGILASFSFRGAMETAALLEFVRLVLLPVLQAGDCVVWDNLSVHKTKAVREAFEEAGVELSYLPPSSPDLNPIELCWSKLKTVLRAAAARTYELLDESISAAIKTITTSDARNWIRHCGYVSQST